MVCFSLGSGFAVYSSRCFTLRPQLSDASLEIAADSVSGRPGMPRPRERLENMPRSPKGTTTTLPLNIEILILLLRRVAAAYPGLPNDLESPSPARLGEEVEEHIGELFKPVGQIRLKILVSGGFVRPVDCQRLSNDVVPGDITPEAAVLTVVAIVSHCEVLAFGDVEGTVTVVKAGRLNVLRVVFLKRLVVDVHGPAHYFYLFSRQADETFDIGHFGTVRIFENDHVAAFQLFVRKSFGKGARVLAIGKLVYQEVIPDQQVRFHGSRRDLEGLHDEGCGKQGYDRGDNDGLKVVPNRR